MKKTMKKTSAMKLARLSAVTFVVSLVSNVSYAHVPAHQQPAAVPAVSVIKPGQLSDIPKPPKPSKIVKLGQVSDIPKPPKPVKIVKPGQESKIPMPPKIVKPGQASEIPKPPKAVKPEKLIKVVKAPEAASPDSSKGIHIKTR